MLAKSQIRNGRHTVQQQTLLFFCISQQHDATRLLNGHCRLLLMESLRGSSFTGQGFEDAVVLAMQHMGFTVRSNTLLNNHTSGIASERLELRWQKYILAKEFCKGNGEPWWRHYQRDPYRQELEIRRPPVTEVDVMAEIGVLTEAEAKSEDRFCGFSENGIPLSIRDFRQRLTGKSWLIEISGLSGDSLRKRDKAHQLSWLLYHADRRRFGEGVALFYNGHDPRAAPPATNFPGIDMIVMMHFLPSAVWFLPVNMMRDQRDAKEEAIQEKDAAIHAKDAAIRCWTVATVALAVCLVVALARKGRSR